MKTFFKVMFVAILAVAVAAPAMAEIKVNGYMRTQMQADNVDGAGAKDAPTASAIDHRFRAKITNQLTDEVKWVYYGEADGVMGDATWDLGADPSNVQTKNVYMSFNVPNSIYSFSLGVMGFSGGFENVVLGQDVAGIKANLALSDTQTVALQYAKAVEGVQTASDDNDIYIATLKNKLANGAKLDLALIHLDFDSGLTLADTVQGVIGDVTAATADAYMIGAKYDGKVGDIGLMGWLLYETGTVDEDLVTETDIDAMAASVKATMGNAAVRFTYITGQDPTETDLTAFTTDLGGSGGTFQMPGENLMIFGTDAMYNNLGSQGVAWNMARFHGMMALNATFNTTISDYYAKFGAGYFMTAEDTATGDDVLGAEVAAKIGKKIAEKVDCSLNLAYAMVDDGLVLDGDDMYKVNFAVNLPF